MDASCSASDSDEELSVGGTTPPPPTDNMDTEEDTKSQEDRKDDVISGEKPLQPIRFSIENILNPEFGKTSPLVSAASTFLGSLNLGALPTSHPLGLFQANFSLFQQAKISNNPLHPLNHVSPILSRNNNQLASSAIDLSLRNPSRSSPESSAPTQFRRQSTSPVNKLRNPSGSSSGSSVAGSQQVPTADDGGASGALKGAKLPEPGKTDAASQQQNLWPAWVYCTRYSDRPSSGPRMRRMRKNKEKGGEEKRPRTAFTAEQLGRLKSEFAENRYLTEKRRQDLARELHLHENQIKIWFQNKRAKIKKASGQKNPLALQLMAQGLYNHTTIPVDEDDEEDLAE